LSILVPPRCCPSAPLYESIALSINRESSNSGAGIDDAVPPNGSLNGRGSRSSASREADRKAKSNADPRIRIQSPLSFRSSLASIPVASRACARDFPIVRGLAQESTRGHPYLSPLSIIHLFILFRSRSKSERSDIRERYDRRYWRGARESSDSFRRVRNNLLNYRMPKVTRVPSDEGPWEGMAGTGRSGCNGGRSGESARDIGMFHGISQAACTTTPFSPSACRTLTLTKLLDRGISRARERERERERKKRKGERSLVQTVHEAAGISRIFERSLPPPRSHGINGLRSRTRART